MGCYICSKIETKTFVMKNGSKIELCNEHYLAERKNVARQRKSLRNGARDRAADWLANTRNALIKQFKD